MVIGEQSHLPPGPKSMFFGLDLYWDSQVDSLNFMKRMVHQYGDIVHFKIGRQPVFLFNDPEDIKNVLTSHYANFLKGRGIARRDNLFGEGLVTSEGDFHHHQRLLTQPGFRSRRIAGYGETIAKVAADSSERWLSGKNLAVLKEMREIALSIAHQTLFGSISDAENDRFIQALREGMTGFRSFKPAVVRAIDSLAFLRQLRLRRAASVIQSIVSRIIAERRRNGEVRDDLLSLLLSRAGAEDGRLTSDRQILDESMTLLVASFEAVATALTWTWYLVGLHPEIQDMLHREVDEVLGGRLPTSDDLTALVYTRRVFEEAMRLYPPVPRLVRTAARDCQVGGYTVPAGSLVIVSQYVTHRDARSFPEPDRFDPDRWTPEAKRVRHPYSYFPFGGGPRRCIGEAFAYMEGVIVLATLASRWKLGLTSHAPVPLSVTHFIHPKGDLAMIPERRSAQTPIS